MRGSLWIEARYQPTRTQTPTSVYLQAFRQSYTMALCGVLDARPSTGNLLVSLQFLVLR
jgi:hypothetical protein